jgi:hypothetical protein
VGFLVHSINQSSIELAQNILGLVAAAFLIISVATVMYPSHEIFAEMFVVPIGALFALTSVRTNLPGAPAGFGKWFSVGCEFGLIMIPWRFD